MSEASVINEACQQQSAQSEYGVGSFFATIDTFAKLNAILDVWGQFTLEDLADAKNPGNIIIEPTSVFQAAIATIDFTINGKHGRTYLWGRPKGKTQDGNTLVSEFGASSGKGLIFVPGSGNNEGCKMMASVAGYTSVFFPVGCAVADSFIYNYPGEDMRGIIGTNGLKLIRAYVENALLIRKSALHILVLIELAAAAKWMSMGHSIATDWPNYTNVGIMGISKGASTAVEAAIYTKPRVCVAASGLTLKDYSAGGLGLTGGNIVPGFMDVWPRGDLVDAIKTSPAKFLYSCSTAAGEIAVMKEEAATDETSNAIAGANVTLVKHTQGHVYPSPNTLNFLQSNL